MRPAPSPRTALGVHPLEDRSAPALFTVTNLMDNGNDLAPVPGSLRAAIEQADATPGADDIVFAAGLIGTINLQNNAGYGGSLIINSDLTITGPDTGKAGGGITVSGGGVLTPVTIDVFNPTSPSLPLPPPAPFGVSVLTATLSNLTVSNGNASSGSGGGIFSGSNSSGVTLTLNRVRVAGNTAANGGGVQSIGSLTINESEITGNSAVGSTSGGITSPGTGGGVNAIGSVTINRSTIASNTASGSGGGLTETGSPVSGSLVVTNSTFDGNTASGGSGGAVFKQFGTAADVIAFEGVTAVRNSGIGIAISASYGGSVPPIGSVRNSVVAENTGGNLGGTFTDAGGNVLGSTTGATFTGGNPASTIVNVSSAGLAALADNGGPTRTALPQSGSPALGRGLPGGSTPATDQRNVPRPASGPIDAGAAQVSGNGRFTAFAAGGGGSATIMVYKADGTLQATIGPGQTFGADFRGGGRVAVWDMNGDGSDDIIVVPGQGGGPVVLVFDVSTGRAVELKRFQLNGLGGPDQRSGFFVAVGNVQGDATPEIVVTPGSSAGPVVDILDYKTGAETPFMAFNPNFRGGLRVAVGDVDFAADGYAEIVVTPGPGGGPVVGVFTPTRLRVGAEGVAVPDRQFLGLNDPNFRGGAFVSVVSVASQRTAVITVTRDSFPNSAGTILADNTFDQAGALSPQALTDSDVALANSVLGVNLFTFNGSAGLTAAGPVASVPVLSPSATGARVAFGVRSGRPGLFVTAGPQNNARAEFYSYDVASNVVSPTATPVDAGFGPQMFSIYVGAGAPAL